LKKIKKDIKIIKQIMLFSWIFRMEKI